MNYENIVKGKFIDRPNRFIAHIEIDGEVRVCHVRNTGRMSELLIKNSIVYVQRANTKNRKTEFSLISFETENGIINVDSLAPNKLFKEANPLNADLIIAEQKYKDSRFDFYVEKNGQRGFCEVKGVTLLGENGTALFPDAPTARGIKHINHLIDLKEEGSFSAIAFIVKIPNIKAFSPNPKDEDFTAALKKAREKNVEIYAFGCETGTDYIKIDKKIDVLL